MLLAEVAAASADVAATASRGAKTARIAACLQLAATEPAVVPVVVAFVSGRLRQRRTGLGWAALRDAPEPAERATLTVEQVDRAFADAQQATGAGSTTERRALLHDLMARATAKEQRLLVGLVTGELRQGALESLVTDAAALAAGVPVASVRRAVTVAGTLAPVTEAVLRDGAAGLAPFALVVGRGLSPMLAGSAPTVAEALARTGPAGLEWKLDGIRVQLHREGELVRVFSRSLDDVTDRLPEVVAAVRELPLRVVVLDGEVLALAWDGRPRPFQVTAARTARRGDPAAEAVRTPLHLFVFDVLHLDGADLLDLPGDQRRARLESVLPTALLTPRLEVLDPTDPEQLRAAGGFAADALARGHEGVVVKAHDAPYAMGRRGAGWVKVKPVHTLDLVVLGAEWGHGRRTGRLSNLHLGARDPDGRFGPPGGFVMLGKTFKGLTDQMLTWQTERLQALADDGGSGSWVVMVRPELVVEVAFDGVQTSPRYPAGAALRFARVVRHRPDKQAAESDPIEQVLALVGS